MGHRSKQAATLDNKNGCWSEKKVFRRIGRSSHHIPVKRKKTTTLQSVDADLKRNLVNLILCLDDEATLEYGIYWNDTFTKCKIISQT